MGTQMDGYKWTIDSLPEGGGVIVVLTNEVAAWVRTGITERCGRDFARRCRVISVSRMASAEKLLDVSGPVVVLDRSFTENAAPAVAAEVDRILALRQVVVVRPPIGG